MKRLRNILRYNIFIVLFVITVTGYVFYYLNNVSSYYSLGYNVIVGKVLSYKIDGNLLSIDLYAKEKLKIRYYFGSYEEKNNFNINLGDIIEVSGELEEGSVNSSFHLFNYRKYLLSNGIKYVMRAQNIKYVYSGDLFLIRNSLRNRIINIDSNGYLLSLIMHDNSYIDYDNLELLNNNGLGRSIIISGFHLILFVKFIDKIIKKNKYHNYICIFILLFYLLLVGISFSLVKSILLYIIMVIFKKRKIFSLTIVFGLFFLINPYYVYNVGFIYSVVISYALSIFRPKNYFNMIYIITLVSFPIDIYYNFEFKLLNPIFNIIFIPIISYFIFPLSWISLIIGNSGVLNFLYSIMLLILNVICKYNISINICYPGILIFFYYVVIYYSIKNRKIYYLIVVLINLLIPYLHSHYVINYIDVGQGDSILIEYPYDRKIILIDTGGIENFQEEW